MAYTTTLTTLGRTLLARAIAGEAELIFTKVDIGSGEYTGDAPEQLTALVNYEKSAAITAITRDGFTVNLNSTVTNVGVETLFDVKEIGIYAKNGDNGVEQLYAYVAITDGDGGSIPASDSVSMERNLLIHIYVGMAETVSAETEGSGYVTVADFNSHLSSDSAHEALFDQKQNKTESLQEFTVTTSLSDSFYIPGEVNNTPYKVSFLGVVKSIRSKLLGNTNGILKSDGSGNISSATAGTDYQQATSGLTAYDQLANDDYFPAYDTSASANRKITWSSIVAKIRSSFFGTTSGILKSNGSGTISAAVAGTDYQQTTNTLSAVASMADADSVPVYSNSEAQHKRITWANIIASIKTSLNSVYQAKFASQTKNQFYAAPNGSNGIPAFRAIAVADLPTVTVQKGGTGNTTMTANAVLVGNGTGAVQAVASAKGALLSTGSGVKPSFGTVPVDAGGTGATDAATARSNLEVTPANIGAAASNHTHSTYVPTTRKVNNKALSSDISLTYTDVGAAAASHSQGASTITAGTFGGKVVCKADSQPYTMCVRNSQLSTTESTPMNGGEICWIYE